MRDLQIRMSAADANILRMLGLHGLALIATSLSLASTSPQPGPGIVLGLAMFATISLLRALNVSRPLSLSTLVLDSAGTALMVAGTGASYSAYIFLALAGAWWAAHQPHRHSGARWAIAFVAVYGVLVIPQAINDATLRLVLEDGSVVIAIAVFADWFVRVDGRAVALSETLASAPAGSDALAIRDGVTRALGPSEVPLDVVLAASRSGLTVIQTELLAYLVLGLTNQEVADATNVSVATVRYRLTGLYRKLGVRGRRAAVIKATELGLAASVKAA